MQAPLRAARSYARLMRLDVPEELQKELLDLAITATARTLAQGPIYALAEARGLRPGELRHAEKIVARLIL